MTFRNKLVLALIPARGGSKGVPRKNLRIINGKPLIAHTINAASGSSRVDRVFLSSDDEEILRTGNSMGVETQLRSADAASDTSTANQVVLDFIGRLSPAEIAANPFLVYLQPTSPLRTSTHIDHAFDKMDSINASTCLSVMALKKTPYKSFIFGADGLLQSLFEEKFSNANRQALPVAYYPNGAIYIFPLSEFLRKGSFPSNGSVPFIMSEKESIDLDTEEDIAMLEGI